MDVEIEAISRRNDLLRDDFDVAVRAGLLSGGALIARRLAEVSVGLFASPSYLARHDAPTARTLASHAMVGLVGQSLATTDYGSGPLRRQRLSTNDPLLIKGFVLDGFALGWLPLYLCRAEIAEGRLIRCLPERTISGPEVFALFHGRPEAPVKVRAFVDFLVTELALR
ncbi:MAG: LysR substrate-binding domain-containing protein [Hyphomonadaceae bacterium]|nr:LysR substrate-binding domain-containing protein [Hyphomonadaceae bacterium]